MVAQGHPSGALGTEEDETEEDGGEASADALAIDGGPSAKATDLARNDPFASTVEDEADWVEPYTMPRKLRLYHGRTHGCHGRSEWPSVPPSNG
jgi:hypothetical protein